MLKATWDSGLRLQCAAMGTADGRKIRLSQYLPGLLFCLTLLSSTVGLCGMYRLAAWPLLLLAGSVGFTLAFFAERWKEKARWVLPGTMAALLLTAILLRKQVAAGLAVVVNAAAKSWTVGTGRLFLEVNVPANASPEAFFLLAGILLGMGIYLLTWFLPGVTAIGCPAAITVLWYMFAGGETLLWLLPLWLGGVLLLLREKGNGKSAFFAAAGTFLLCACLSWGVLSLLGGSPLHSVRENFQQKLHTLRYETAGEALPEGRFSQMSMAGRTEDTALLVTMEQPESLYLRGFVGERFTALGWEALDKETLAEHAQLLYWLHQGNFYPQSQLSAAAKSLSGQIPESGTQVTVKNISACRSYLYAPYSLSGSVLLQPRQLVLQGAMLPADGLKGQSDYQYTVVQKAASQLEAYALALSAAPEESREYLSMESGYRDFVYSYAAQLPESARSALQPLLDQCCADYGKAEDLTLEQAVECMQRFLQQTLSYSTEVSATAERENFLQNLLSDGRGFDCHYATLAVLALRYYGVPARYAEGYLLTQEAADKIAPGGTVQLQRSDAHAWAEVYQDGLGWLPLEVTPGYDAALGNLPQDGQRSDGSGTESENGETGTQPGGENGKSWNEGQELEQQEEQTAQEQPQERPQDNLNPTTALKKGAWWLLGMVLLLALAAVVLYWRRKRILSRRIRLLEDENAAEAIAANFAYGVQLLYAMGLPLQMGPMEAMTGAMEQRFGEETAGSYQKMAVLNNEALFSEHRFSAEQREEMRGFSQKMIQLRRQERNFAQRAFDRWIRCLY